MMRGATEKKHLASRLLLIAGCLISPLLISCQTEILRQQEEKIRQQQGEITRQRREIDELVAAKQKEERKRINCNRAFREFFDKAQSADDRESAVALYRQGLDLCPDDDVAHYELGKLLDSLGRYREAEQEFAAAVKLNPDFQDAKEHLEAARKRRQGALGVQK